MIRRVIWSLIFLKLKSLGLLLSRVADKVFVERIKGKHALFEKVWTLTCLCRKANAVDINMDTDEVDDEGPLHLPFGQLYFGFSVVPPPSADEKDDKKPKHVFTGSGQTLRNKKK